MKLYVGNISFETTRNDLQDLFSAHGRVMDALVVTDKMSSRSRGFGFVTMSTPDEGTTAINALDGQQVDGRNLTVNEARPREESQSGNNHSRPTTHRRF